MEKTQQILIEKCENSINGMCNRSVKYDKIFCDGYGYIKPEYPTWGKDRCTFYDAEHAKAYIMHEISIGEEEYQRQKAEAEAWFKIFPGNKVKAVV